MRARRKAVLLFSTLGAIFTAEMVAGQAAVDQIVTAENRRIEQAQAAQDQIDGIFNYESVLLTLNEHPQLREKLCLVYPREGTITADYPPGVTH